MSTRNLSVRTVLHRTLAVVCASWLSMIFLPSSQAAGFTRLAPTAEQPLDIGIWYPSEAVAPSAPNTPFGQALAIDADPVGDELPMVILSHGNAGWMGSHADTALALANAGYVAVALTHADDNTENEDVAPAVWMNSRPRELVASIDVLMQRWPGATRLSASRIGVFGFSAGAYTALVAAGAVPNMDLAVRHCKTQPLEYVCVIGLVDDVAGDDTPAILDESVSDSRIKAVSVAAPAFGFAFDGKALDALTMPVQIWSGSLDERVPHDSNGGVIASFLPSEAEVERVADAGHFAFLASCNPALETRNPRVWAMVCVDAPGFDRAAFHEFFNARVVAFFDRAMP